MKLWILGIHPAAHFVAPFLGGGGPVTATFPTTESQLVTTKFMLYSYDDRGNY